MNPAQSGTPGGGSGAIYNDGDTYTLFSGGCLVTYNQAQELAGAIFYVSNDLSGSIVIDQSAFSSNPGKNVQSLKGFFVLAKDSAVVTNSTIE